MPIDQSPSTVATNALNALDFASLIGGPMDAIVTAQALAARTTYEYITEVGLNTDPKTGEKTPVNVVFQYNNNGQMTTLTVPILVMIPIPNLEVTQFSIDFLANISASSSSTQETTSDSELGVDAEAEASLGIGPFSIRVKAKANYSSKQHSKAAQESKYSVEYTMNVHVEGGQAGMPAGMQTVLNILQGSNSSVSPDEQVAIYPAVLEFLKTGVADLQVTIKNRQGVFLPGVTVAVSVVTDPSGSPSPFESITTTIGANESNVRTALNTYQNKRSLADHRNPALIIDKRVLNAYAKYYKNSPAGVVGDSDSATTNEKGTVGFQFVLKDAVLRGDDDVKGTLIVTASIPEMDEKGNVKIVQFESFNVPYVIIPDDSPLYKLSPTQGSITLNPTTMTGTITVNVTTTDPKATVPASYEVKAVVNDPSAATDFTAIAISPGTAVGTPTPDTATGTVDSSGAIGFVITAKSGYTPGTYTLIVSSDAAEDMPVDIILS